MIFPKIFQLIEERDFHTASKLISSIENEDVKSLYYANLLRAEGEIVKSLQIINDLLNKREIEDIQIIAEAMLNRARTFWKDGKFKKAKDAIIELLEKTEMITILSDHPEIFGYSYHLLGGCFHVKGQYDEALKNYERAIHYREKVENQGQLALTLVNVAALYQEKSEFALSQEYNKRALQINETLENKDQISLILNNLGNLYRSQGKLVDSLNYFDIAEKMAIELNDRDRLFLVRFNKGYTFQMFGEFSKAKEYYNSCFEYYVEHDFEEDLANLKNNLGYIYWRLGEPNKAIKELTESLDLRKSFGNVYEISETLLMLIRFDTANSDQLKKEMDQLYIKNSEDKILEIRAKLAKALIEKQNKRLVNKLGSMKYFQEITDDEIIDYEASVVALTNLCELLLLEFKSTQSEEILNETKKYLTQLSEIAVKQNMIVLQIYVLILESKLSILALDVEKAEMQLENAYELANDKEMVQMTSIVKKEQELLFQQVNFWNQASLKSDTVMDRFKNQKIEEYLDLVFH